MNADPGAFIFTADESDAGKRLDYVIASHLIRCSRTQAANLIRDGFIRLDNLVVKPAHRVRFGDEIQGHVPPPKSTDIIPEPIELDTLYKDKHFIVINKPAGRVVHPAPGHETGTLVHGLLYHFPGLFSVGGRLRPGIVHRLDKDTSGCLVVALNDWAHQEISGLFKARTVYKEYLALVHGTVSGNMGRIDRPIGRHPVDRKKMTVNGRHAHTAQTNWRVVRRFPSATLIRLYLKTGRTHQIRVHLNALGHPVVGDRVYGPRRKVGILEVSPSNRVRVPRQMLHARYLGFVHPASGKKVIFKAPIPKDMAAIIGALNCHLQPEASKSILHSR